MHTCGEINIKIQYLTYENLTHYSKIEQKVNELVDKAVHEIKQNVIGTKIQITKKDVIPNSEEIP